MLSRFISIIHELHALQQQQVHTYNNFLTKSATEIIQLIQVWQIQFDAGTRNN